MVKHQTGSVEGTQMPASARLLREALAAGVKAARQRLELRQEDAAVRARACGLTTWIRGTVGQAEVGARGLGLEEMLLLALTYQTTLAELVAGGEGDLVEITPDARLSVGTLRALLSGERVAVETASAGTIDVPATRGSLPRRSGRFPNVLAEAKRFGIGDRGLLEHALDEVGEAERHAARKLGTTPERVNLAAVRRWGRTLAEERDHRLKQQGVEMTARRRQALRGHITRDLIAELDSDLGAER